MDEELLKFVKERIAAHFGANVEVRVILFGSRVRGNHEERSDHDLAFEIRPFNEEAWTRFHLDLLEEAPTLKGIDAVNLLSCAPGLKREIEKTGRVIYEGKIEQES